MRYKVFGRRTGLRVSELALGTGNFGTGWGHGVFSAEQVARLDAASEVELGVPHVQIKQYLPSLMGGQHELFDYPLLSVA